MLSPPAAKVYRSAQVFGVDVLLPPKPCLDVRHDVHKMIAERHRPGPHAGTRHVLAMGIDRQIVDLGFVMDHQETQIVTLDVVLFLVSHFGLRHFDPKDANVQILKSAGADGDGDRRPAVGGSAEAARRAGAVWIRSAFGNGYSDVGFARRSTLHPVR